uniref:CTP synthase n=1 Tax=Globodera pallida TaxID=36090 RepID=A0A183BQY6_GLOPA
MAEEPVKLILVTGGVMSGIGKGIVSSSLGVVLKAYGYRVTAIKIDPYLNFDAGTLSPFEHGEVFVLDDGGEVDLDLGNYERFLGIRLTRDNNITTGKINHQIYEREKEGKYSGKTVGIVPHLTDSIIEWVERVSMVSVDGTGKAPHVCIVELGGTIGDIEGMPYTKAFSAAFQRKSYRNRFLTVHVTKLLHEEGEIKTKPAQNGIRSLRETGLIPDVLMCRSQKPITAALRAKIAAFALRLPSHTGDRSSMFTTVLATQLQLPVLQQNDQTLDFFSKWGAISEFFEKSQEEVRIALVAKYVKADSGKVFTDAYASVVKALQHAAVCASRKVNIRFISSELLEMVENGGNSTSEYERAWEELRKCHGILVPGGFGNRGTEGKIEACICLGLQCAAIEFARNVCGIDGANSTEFAKNLSDKQQVVIDMPEHASEKHGMGATMRLGKRETVFLTEDSLIRKLYYNQESVDERHRHRYEACSNFFFINPSIVPELTKKGLRFVGVGVDETSAAVLKIVEKKLADPGELVEKVGRICGGFVADKSSGTAIRMEMAELLRDTHPFFIGVQYHPEYLSSAMQPSPPFLGLLLAASGQLESHLDNKLVPSPTDKLSTALKNWEVINSEESAFDE